MAWLALLLLRSPLQLLQAPAEEPVRERHEFLTPAIIAGLAASD
jgi:hypothetical protein